MAEAKIKFTAPLRVGDVIVAVLDGMLRSVRVESIGADWVVLRGKDSLPRFLDIDPEILAESRESRGGPLPTDMP